MSEGFTISINYDQLKAIRQKYDLFSNKNNKSEIVGVLQLLNNRNGGFEDRDENS